MGYDTPTRAFVLVTVAPNGAQKVVGLFTAESLEAAEAYTAQLNETDLDKHAQRFRITGEFPVLTLLHDDRTEYADAPYYAGL